MYEKYVLKFEEDIFSEYAEKVDKRDFLHIPEYLREIPSFDRLAQSVQVSKQKKSVKEIYTEKQKERVEVENLLYDIKYN